MYFLLNIQLPLEYLEKIMRHESGKHGLPFCKETLFGFDFRGKVGSILLSRWFQKKNALPHIKWVFLCG